MKLLEFIKLSLKKAKQQRLIKEAHALLDKIEDTLIAMVEKVKEKKSKKV